MYSSISALTFLMISCVNPIEQTTVSVAEFGAKPDDGEDDTAAIRAAVAKCQILKNPVLLFPRGRYELQNASYSKNRRAIEINNCQGLTIDGQGSELIFTGLTIPFYIENSQNVSLKNLSIDWDRPPFSQGTVISASENELIIALDPRFSLPPGMEVYGIMDFDASSEKGIASFDLFHSLIRKIEYQDPLTIKVSMAKKAFDVPGHSEVISKALAGLPGKTVVLRHYNEKDLFPCWGIRFLQCSDIKLEDVNIYSCVGLAFHASVTKNISCKRLNVAPRPGSGRLMSSTLDAWHCAFISGEVRIEDCKFENMGDDGINLYSKYLSIDKYNENKLFLKVASQGWQGPTPMPGEIMTVMHQTDLSPYGDLTVKSAKWDRNSKSFHVEFMETLPEKLQSGDIVVNKSYEPKTMIKNCVIKGNRARGILISSPNVTVENCRIESTTHAGIMIFADTKRQARVPSNITIKNNQFIDCGGAAIYIYAKGSTDSKLPLSGAIKNIDISNNSISYSQAPSGNSLKFRYPKSFYWQAGICAYSTDNLSIRNNNFHGFFDPEIVVNCSKNVLISGNISDRQGKILSSTEKNTGITIDNNKDMIKQSENIDSLWLWRELHFSAYR